MKLQWMLQWMPFSTPPKEGQLILIRPREEITSFEMVKFQSCLLQYNRQFYGTHWMPADLILKAPKGYDPEFGDNKMCFCGHPYYQHFDSYANMSPVGCEYCHFDIEGVEYKKRTPVPAHVDVSKFTHDDWKPFASICSGFKWDGVEVPIADK